MRFDSSLTEIYRMPNFPPEVVREEKSQCRVPCSVAAQAGPVHEAFVAALPCEWRADSSTEIFSRLLWLKEGWYPLAMGFHLDWGPSAENSHRVETLVANFGGHSFTEFVVGSFELPDLPEELRRRAWPAQVESMVASGELQTARLRSGVMARFDNDTWHRATPATSRGWRLLVRAIRGLPASRRHDGTSKFTSVRNDYVPQTPGEIERYASYCT